MPDLWNHNIQYQKVLLSALPRRCGSALDLGCGQGYLLGRLAERANRVVGIDQHPPSLAEARQRVAGLDNVRVLDGDAMTAGPCRASGSAATPCSGIPSSGRSPSAEPTAVAP